MTILDTHAWIWWVNESPQLSPAAQGAIETANDLGVHLISCWEVAMLVEKGHLGLRLDIDQWVDEALRRPKINLLPCTPAWPYLRPDYPASFTAIPPIALLSLLVCSRGQSNHPRCQD